MDSSYPAYLDLLRELSGDLDRLAELDRKKADVVRKDDLIGLDEVLKQEQAVALSLRGLEQRRLKLVPQLGLTGVPLSQLEEHCPEELRDRARQTVEALRQSYQIYRSNAGMARELLELNLHHIEQVIASAGVDPKAPGAGYEAPGVEPPSNMKTDFRA